MAASPDDTLLYLVAAIEGVDLGAQVTHLDIEDHDRLIDRATLVLEDPYGAIGDLPREGQALKVDLGWASEHAVLFDGDIVRVIVEARAGGARRVTLVAFDPSYRLMQGAPRTRDHTGALSDILTAIVGEYGLPIGQVELDPDPSFDDDLPLRQTNRKDWAFVQDIVTRYGARAFFEFNDGASKFYAVSEARLMQGDSQGAIGYVDGPGQLLEFRWQRLAASAAPLASAITLDPATGAPVTAPPPAPPAPEALPMADPARVQALGTVGDGGPSDDYSRALEQVAAAQRTPDQQRPVAVLAGVPSDPTLPDRAALALPTRALGLHGEGIAVGTVMLRAKGKLTIQGIANWAEGDWYVSQVNHVMTDKSYFSRFLVTR